MKKTYAKPMLYAESFALVEHIAGNCATPDSFAGAQHRGGTCGYNIGGIVLFTQGVNDCDNETLNSMIEFAEFDPAGKSNAEIAELLGIDCYNSMYSAGTSFFAS